MADSARTVCTPPTAGDMPAEAVVAGGAEVRPPPPAASAPARPLVAARSLGPYDARQLPAGGSLGPFGASDLQQRRAKLATAPAAHLRRVSSWASWLSIDNGDADISDAMEASSELLLYRSFSRMPTMSQAGPPTQTVWSVLSAQSGGGQGQEPQATEAAATERTYEKPQLTAGTLAVVALLNLVDCINMNLLTPYAADMVGSLLDQGPTSPTVLRNVGLLIGIYNISEMIFSPGWGRLSDRFGRRPIILVSLGGAAIVPIAFGLSQSFAMALAVRAFNGVLCGSLGITKTYVAEIVEKGKEAKAFSVITACYSVGMMIGPALGGLLQTPAKWSPAMDSFLDSGVLRIFKTNPYLLPNVVFTIFAGTVWLLVFFFLKESLPYEEREARRAELAAEREQKLEAQRAARAEEGTAGGEQERATRKCAPRLSYDALAAQLPFLTYPWTVLRATAAYGLCVGYVIATVQNIILLFQIPVDEQGFGLSPDTLGLLQNCAAAGLLVTQLCLYPRLVRLKGYRWCIWLGLISVLTVTVPMPLYGLLYDPSKFAGVRMVPLVVMMVIQQAAFGFCTPTTMVWINRFAEGLDRGEVNGWANSFAALCRALAPIFVGNLQSLGASMTWQGGRYLALYAISLLSLAVGFLLLPVLPVGPPVVPTKQAETNIDEEEGTTEEPQSDEEETQPEPSPRRAGMRS